MAKRRKKIRSEIETEILFNSDKTCCICKDPNKGGQIHHIDEDPGNNDPSNLIVVCTHHHDEIHKKSTITKGFSPNLLRKYKRIWEQTVREKRPQGHDPLRSPSGIEKTLFEFEIRRVAYEIVALSDDDIDEINQRLDFLHTIYLLEDLHEYTKQILDNLSQIAIVTGLKGGNKCCLIVDKTYDFFLHLPGREEFEIPKEDIDNLATAIRIIGIIGQFSAEFGRDTEVVKSVTRAFGSIWDILIWYDLGSHALFILDEIDEILEGCEYVYEDEEPLVSGIKEISKLHKKLKEVTIAERPDWGEVIEKLNEV